MARILLVEDDPRIARPLARDLRLEWHALDVATDGEEGWEFLQSTAYDLAIIDVLLPKLDGIQLCQRARLNRLVTPVLLLTALDTTVDKVRGLDAGADDYLVKPFSLEELHARIRALLRRSHSPAPVLAWGTLRLDPASRSVTVDGSSISLTPKEYQLLELFLRSPRRVLGVNEILERVWGWDAPGPGTVKTHLKGLREKLRAASLPNPIDTLYGQGYRLASEP